MTLRLSTSVLLSAIALTAAATFAGTAPAAQAGTAPAPATSKAGTPKAGTPKAGTSKAGTPRTYAYNAGHGNHIYAHWNTWDRSKRRVPWLITVHGGYWRSGTGNDIGLAQRAENERARGLAVFTLDYRKVPAVTWPTPERDIETAIHWIRVHGYLFGLDQRKGFILGGSSGVLQSTIAALRVGGFAGIISMGGVSDAWAAYSDPVQTGRKLKPAALALMGGVKPWDDYARWGDARAANHRLEKPRQAFLLLHSVADRTVNIKMDEDLDRALRADHYRVWFKRLPGDVHVLTRPSDYAIVNHWMDGILNGSLR